MKSFTAGRRYTSITYFTAVVIGGSLGATLLVASKAVAQDAGREECGIACQVVIGGGDASVQADPLYPDLVSPDTSDDAYAAPEPAPPAPDPSADPYSVDTDGDGVPDGYEGVDSDFDGVWDWYEIYVYGTDPLVADQPMRSEGGSDLVPADESGEEDCTYATPDTCFPRVKPDDEKRE